jgi:hypothetical protein
MPRCVIRIFAILRSQVIVEYELYVFAGSRLVHQRTHYEKMVNPYVLVTVNTEPLVNHMNSKCDQSSVPTASLKQLACFLFISTSLAFMIIKVRLTQEV